jgi:site-specific DNA recombinase
MDNHKQTAIYARVSSEKQANEGTVESQLFALREFALSNGHRVDEDLIFVDNGVSGATLARPALDSLRDRAAAGEIEKILVHTPDRLARKYAHQLVLIEEFHRLGVEIIFINRNISDTPEDQLLLQIQGVISEYEREKIMERGRRGKLHKARQGKVQVLAGAPYGYIYSRATDTEDARYEIDRREAEVVRRIYRMLVNEGISLRTIAHTLTKERIPTPRKVKWWGPTTVRLILTNPAYMGKAAYGKTRSVETKRRTKRSLDRNGYPQKAHSGVAKRPKEEWVSIPVPAIIDEDTFNRVQERLEENKRFSPRNNRKYEYLLSGLLRCKQCNYAMYGRAYTDDGVKRLYYRCRGADGSLLPNGKACSSRMVRVEVIDELVWEQVKGLLEHPEMMLKEYKARVEHKKEQRDGYRAMAAKKRKEIKLQEREKERLLDLYQTGLVELSEIEERLKEIRARIKRLGEESRLLEENEKEDAHRLQLIERFDDFAKRMRTNLEGLSFVERRQIVRLLVERVMVDTKAWEINVHHILPLNGDFTLRTGGGNALLQAGEAAGGLWRADSGLSPVRALRGSGQCLLSGLQASDRAGGQWQDTSHR